MILSDPELRFQGHMVIRPINALDVLCAQLTRDLFAIAKFLFRSQMIRKLTVTVTACR